MAWEGLIVAGTAAVGVAAIYNERIRRRATLSAPLPPSGANRWYQWRGHRVAYTVRGAGSPVVLLHGIHAAASSFEWRETVPALAHRHTVFTIDLLGFGDSDRPRVRYSPALYLALITDFLAEVVSVPAAIVANSLSGAYAIAVAATTPERAAALVLVQPTGLTRFARNLGRIGDLIRLPIESPVIGTALCHALTSRRRIRRGLRRAFADPARVTDETVDAYYASAHQPGAKHAIAALLSFQLGLDIRGPWSRLTQPALLCWGSEPWRAPLKDLRAFRRARADVEGLVIADAGDLPHDERADDFNEMLTEFLVRLPARPVPGSPASVEHRASDS